MKRLAVEFSLTALVALTLGCGERPAAVVPTAPPAAAPSLQLSTPPAASPLGANHSPAPTRSAVEPSAPPQCVPAEWSAGSLTPLLAPGKTASSQRDQPAAMQLLFSPECSDAPGGPRQESPNPVVADGVEIGLTSATPAGSSGRGWAGSRCSFSVRRADGSGKATALAAAEIPPFTTISAVVRAGSAAWLSVSYNGYTAEFPKGGNRVVAIDLCAGRVVWQSKDSTSNGGLLLLGDYLIAPFGFTRERRYVFVLNARSGAVVQKLPVIENVCPSSSWAPNHRPGDRCDAPGQAVGAATAPRVENGVFLVDTNTGSAAFQFLGASKL